MEPFASALTIQFFHQRPQGMDSPDLGQKPPEVWRE
jgi:hypothetical protein